MVGLLWPFLFLAWLVLLLILAVLRRLWSRLLLGAGLGVACVSGFVLLVGRMDVALLYTLIIAVVCGGSGSPLAHFSVFSVLFAATVGLFLEDLLRHNESRSAP